MKRLILILLLAPSYLLANDGKGGDGGNAPYGTPGEGGKGGYSHSTQTFAPSGKNGTNSIQEGAVLDN
ncbi:hypothetical protein RO21_10730 [[Actinobacillus] muris]|uniref:Uncharacterized protein n=1 Tax=Muribacter muris TaxID=67855 RepID=A0A0J5P278_9PAST|nr:hypothetical protein [Muribacter muris]KMK50638.1 hypothetical protein RO21_10730 [[Actinobacillus] muris] [Muribacter muris]